MSQRRRLPIKYLVLMDDENVQCWRMPDSRFGGDRSRRILNRFPDRADSIARATIEGGSRPHARKAVRHG